MMTTTTVQPPAAIVVMGVSGSGKSTLGARLATALACPFLEGDDFHSDANVRQMRAGLPLDDARRWPWLDRLGAEVVGQVTTHGLVVLACSALKRCYRERLATAAAGVPLFLVLLDVGHDELTHRLNERHGHYMPASLLDSQLAILERPGSDERALVLDATRPVDALCTAVIAWLSGLRAEVR